MMKYALCSIAVLTPVTLYLGYKSKLGLFQKMIRLFLFIISIHAAFLFIGSSLDKSPAYFSFIPFAFIYGPLLYLISETIAGIRPPLQKVLIHALPFTLAVIIYVMHGFYPEWFNDARLNFLHHSLKMMSMFSYAVWILLFTSNQKEIHLRAGQRLVKSLALLLLLTATAITISIDFVSIPIAYCILLCVVFLIFRYTINGFLNIGPLVNEGINDDNKDAYVKRYQKSTLSAALMDTYEEKLHAAMTSEKIYLDAELSLWSLAKALRIPKHHLTQVLSVRIEENFYQYVNRFRIDYACKLINQSDTDLTLEELAYKSGFNSKTSFNRYFKKQIGCTPSEYRNL